MESSRSRKRARQDWDGAGAPPPTERAVVARGAASPPWRDDDRDGHYVFELGENLNRRYKILSKMGEGTFGRVLECWDRETREYVAIKVVRSIRKYRDAAMIEIDVLKRLAENERYRSLCVQIQGWFDYRNHICIKNSQDETHFKCLPKSSAIKLIDFGSTAFDKQEHSSIVSTRHYRAPEIILGLGWSFPCDIWSVGCILVELCSTHENLEHLAMMERVLGSIPENMIRKASSSAQKYFRRGARLNWPEGAISRESIRAVKKLDRLKDLVARNADHSRAALADLLYGLLKFEPSERLTAQEALDHPFFRNTT
uniref:Protein kinase domain-containing protein n=1 Tax=Leersia perrieri TaxID=77586 RepID=A0A0D9V2G2_9ORYZ